MKESTKRKKKKGKKKKKKKNVKSKSSPVIELVIPTWSAFPEQDLILKFVEEDSCGVLEACNKTERTP